MPIVRKSICVAVLFSLISGCATDDGIQLSFGKVTDKRICARNFQKSGDTSTGTYYISHRWFKQTSKKEAVSNLIRYILSLGWKIYNVDTELGLISAIPQITYVDNLEASLRVILNVIVTEERNGLTRVECTFYATMGQNISDNDAREELCNLLDATTKGDN